MTQTLIHCQNVNSVSIGLDNVLRVASLPVELPGAMGELRDATAPVVHIIGLSDVSTILERLGSIIYDCGTQGRSGLKQQTLELSRYLPHKCGKNCKPGCNKIDLLRAVYNDPGRVHQGVARLLSQPAVHGHLFLVAVNMVVFEKLLRRAYDQDTPKQGYFLGGIKDDPELAEIYHGCDAPFVRVRKQILVAAKNNLPVLILGESGTGKELVARAIHKRSERTGERFVPVNCAAISPNLLESELFGIEPGGADGVRKRRIGLWEEADHGTLFLDEIGDMSLDHQTRILRALQNKEIRRIGSNSIIKVDARVISATNKDLLGMIAHGKFIGDLYSRLNGLQISTPALRDCPLALSYVAQREWQKITMSSAAILPKEIIDELSKFTAVGNYRDLKNALLRLYAYMSAEGLDRVDRVYFLEVMKNPLRRPPSIDAGSNQERLTVYRIECRDNLRKAARYIRKCKVALRPLLHGGAQDQAGIDRLSRSLMTPHDDLDELCLDPSLFYNHETHAHVAKFTGRVAGLIQVLQSEPSQALAYWQENLNIQYSLVLTLIQNQIKELADA
jgi:hypothetical protein